LNSYDYEDRITGITFPSSATDSFSYNGLDTRVGKTDSTGTYSCVRDGAGVTAPVLDDGAANYTPGVSQHRSGSTTFENEDYLGTSNRQTNTSQSSLDRPSRQQRHLADPRKPRSDRDFGEAAPGCFGGISKAEERPAVRSALRTALREVK
jgi:YD repeat-containing protein